jgi:hypothetical protein
MSDSTKQIATTVLKKVSEDGKQIVKANFDSSRKTPDNVDSVDRVLTKTISTQTKSSGTSDLASKLHSTLIKSTSTKQGKP